MPDDIPIFEPRRFRVVAIGSSTGGPILVQKIICGLPADLPVPILIAQHLPPLFTHELAKTMERESPLTIVEAEDGQPVYPGTVYLAPGSMHMRVIKDCNYKPTIQISKEPTQLLYKPSVDELFDSCADVYTKDVLGIVMTGIGEDGKIGATRLVQSGSVILTQNQETCAVYGMPKSCDRAGLSSAQLTPEQIRLAIHQLSPSFKQGDQNSVSNRSA
jgi:two-component system chemotaxis response regulator CheB